MHRFRYYCNCVSWPSDDVDAEGGLCDMVNAAIGITRGTFMQHANHDDLRELETALGYERTSAQGLTMARDWHVSYHRSKLHGQRVYFFKHSAIEYVFTRRTA